MNPQDCKRSQVGVAVEAADGLAHRIDAIGEGEKRMEETEEGGHHLDGIQASRARNLQHDNDDT